MFLFSPKVVVRCIRHPDERCAQSRDAPDTVKQGTGPSGFTVSIALLLVGDLREGRMATRLGEGRLGIPQTPPSALCYSESANVPTVTVGLSSGLSEGTGAGTFLNRVSRS